MTKTQSWTKLLLLKSNSNFNLPKKSRQRFFSRMNFYSSKTLSQSASRSFSPFRRSYTSQDLTRKCSIFATTTKIAKKYRFSRLKTPRFALTRSTILKRALTSCPSTHLSSLKRLRMIKKIFKIFKDWKIFSRWKYLKNCRIKLNPGILSLCLKARSKD